jgi:hypothetical protein
VDGHEIRNANTSGTEKMTLFRTKIAFGAYPTVVRLGISFLCLGWLLHLIYYLRFFVTESLDRNDYLMFAVGIAICYFTASINKWARMLSIFFNIGIIFMYTVLFFFQKSAFDTRMFAAAVIAAFILASFYLLRRETADYFRSIDAEPRKD